MKSFSDFNIETTIGKFTGKKIEIGELTGTEIIVKDYKIAPSKRYPEKGNGNMLTLQIEFEGRDRVVFTGSVILQDQCEKAATEGEFPFKTTIIELKPNGFKFT